MKPLGAAAIAAGLLCAAGTCAAELNDPTRPPDEAASPVPAAASAGAEGQGWDLTSTLVAPSRRVAVINGELVTAGSRVGGMTVREIAPGRVVLEGEGRRRVLTLSPGSVKKPVHRRAAAAGRAP